MSASQLFLIRTDLTKRGEGSPDNPWRVVTQYWTPEGEMVAEVDHLLKELQCDRCRTHNSRDGTPETCRHCLRIERDQSRATTSELHTLQQQLRREVSVKSEQLATLKLTLESQQHERHELRLQVSSHAKAIELLQKTIDELRSAAEATGITQRTSYRNAMRAAKRKRKSKAAS